MHPDPDSTPPEGTHQSRSYFLVCSLQRKKWVKADRFCKELVSGTMPVEGRGTGYGPNVQLLCPRPLTKTFAGKRSGDWVQIFFLSPWRWQALTQSPGRQQSRNKKEHMKTTVGEGVEGRRQLPCGRLGLGKGGVVGSRWSGAPHPGEGELGTCHVQNRGAQALAEQAVESGERAVDKKSESWV